MPACYESEIIDNHVVCEIGEQFHLAVSPDIILHLATPASASMNIDEPRKMLDLNIRAMTWILDNEIFLRKTPTVSFSSSGAVYGAQPKYLDHIPEAWNGAPNPLLPGIA
jgi:nucleoside-diphosphate-sugar epimerase